MSLFRNHVPQRTGESGQFNTYSEYKDTLKIDFYECCGYCNDSHNYMGGWRGMQIDHFAPRTPFVELEHEYDNLVYSCFYCNNAKSNDWVSDSPDRPISDDGTRGYVNPREEAYTELFSRNSNGSIRPMSNLGLYIYTNLNLGLLRHELINTMEKIFSLTEKIDLLIEKGDLNNEVETVLINNRGLLIHKRFKLEKQFREIINAR